MPRVARYVVERGWLHLALLCGVGVFALPLVWMVATSLKIDQELTEPGWFPRLPTFVPSSPYVLEPVDVVRPMAVDDGDWEKALPEIKRVTRQAVDRAAPLSDAHAEAATSVAMARLVHRLNLKLWEGDPAALLAGYTELLTPQVIAESLRDRLARLELRGVLLRTLDGRMSNLCDGDQFFDRFVVESGDAAIVRGPAGAPVLRYHFASASATPVVLRFDFDSPAAARELHKLIFSYVPDNSWHRIDAELTIGKTTWRSSRTSYVAQNRPGSILFQPPSFDDETYRPRIWVPLREVVTPSPGTPGEGRGEGSAALPRNSQTQKNPHPNPLPSEWEREKVSASLRLTLSPSSTARAVYGKVQWNYSRAFRHVPFLRYVGNSLLLVGLTTVATLFSSTFVAYAFARLRWPGRGVAFVILLATMMLPAQVTMIPSFLVWKQVGWYNTLNPMWVPALFGGAFFVFLMVQHMKTIPRELEEAARIDGLSAIQTWWYVIVPLVKPAAAAIAIMTVMGAWNEFLGPLIYLRDQSKFPLSLGLYAVRLEEASDWTMLMACNVLMTLPMVLMFVLFQRYFIQGMTMSGMKG
jgi:ABC-type glycerol-3-phosphate transport system permease component